MLEELSKNWSAISSGRKAALLGGLLAVLAIFVALSMWTFKQEYQVLFSDLDPQDAAQMLTELERLKVDYKLEDSGSTILVSESAVHKTRLKLMGKGLTLRGNVGFELFNNSDYGTTEFAQKVNYQRALQGELARTIMALDEVKQARVHLVLPEKGLLKKQSGQAKASITLNMKSNAKLTQDQVIGTQRLVATAVPEMDPASVTIIDHKGIALSQSIAGDTSTEWTTAQLEVKKQIETYFNKKVSTMLDKALGEDKAVVTTDVSLNFDHVKTTTEESISPIEASRKSIAEIVPEIGDVKKIPAILKEELPSFNKEPSQAPNPTIKTISKSDNPNKITGKRIEQIISDPGSVKRLSIGVILPSGIDQQKVSELKEIIAMAVGLNNSRGDAIAIHINSELKNAETAVPKTELDEQKKAPITNNIIRNDKNQTFSIPTIYWAAGSAIFILLLASFVLSGKRDRTSKYGRKDLSPEEREEMLKKITEWIRLDSTRPKAVDKS